MRALKRKRKKRKGMGGNNNCRVKWVDKLEQKKGELLKTDPMGLGPFKKKKKKGREGRSY